MISSMKWCAAANGVQTPDHPGKTITIHHVFENKRVHACFRMRKRTVHVQNGDALYCMFLLDCTRQAEYRKERSAPNKERYLNKWHKCIFPTYKGLGF